MPGILIVPLGLAVLVIVAGIFCDASATAPLAAPALAVVGVAGLLVGRRSIARAIRDRARGINVWALVAAIGAWALVAAPIVLTGKPGFTGYGRIVDISYEFDLAVHFAHSGRHIPAAGSSGYQVALKKYLEAGYPGGGPWTLGALSNLTPVDLTWLYQSFLAFLAGMSALSIYFLLGRLLAGRALRAVAAIVAALPNVLYAYVLEGGIKELSTSCFLLLTAAVLGPVMARLRPGRGLLAVPVALAATVASFSLTTLPWVGVLCVGTCATAVVFSRARVMALLGCLQMAVIGFVLALPTLGAAFKLLPIVSGAGPVDLGNLSAPVPGISAAGVWISDDVRFPQHAHRGLSEAIAVLVIVLAVGGVLHALRRRQWNVAWLGAAGAVTLYYVAHRYGPWIQFKADCITSPIALLLAFAGVGGLARAFKARRGGRAGRLRLATVVRVVGLVAGAVIVAAVLGGNALTYHDTSLAPYARLRDLQQIGERFAGQGPTLTPDFEEYAEYYLRDDDQDSMVNGPALSLRAGVNRETEPGGIFAYDLDEYTPGFVESFRTIVMRRNPLASRPPSNYRLVYSSPYYLVWQRTAPASTIVAHLHFADQPADKERSLCREALVAARKAGPRASVAYTLPPHGYIQVDGSNMVTTRYLPGGSGTIFATGPGTAVREQPVPKAGRYELLLQRLLRPTRGRVRRRTARGHRGLPGELSGPVGPRRLGVSEPRRPQDRIQARRHQPASGQRERPRRLQPHHRAARDLPERDLDTAGP